ncbi:hypothetical protein MAPG_05896 [Magnaporthiopsis poae ATCC 64411]|uniref:Uncharacterized protein n=1 Tax=Magnaporthiopsis poae (strain ATCC 64411 / 73-15) TaxID=644358 RepID=A0A0C4E0L6_MAGP6|nr:hypothetical protein MAPG_05896 [Magnaporthiopsis poae ATCC 64411]
MPCTSNAAQPELSAKHAEALRSLIQSHVSTRPRALGGSDAAGGRGQGRRREFNKQALAALVAARELPGVMPEAVAGSILTPDQIDEIFAFFRERIMAYTGSWLILSHDCGVIFVDSNTALDDDLQWELDAFAHLYARLAGVLEPFVEFRTGVRYG